MLKQLNHLGYSGFDRELKVISHTQDDNLLNSQNKYKRRLFSLSDGCLVVRQGTSTQTVDALVSVECQRTRVLLIHRLQKRVMTQYIGAVGR